MKTSFAAALALFALAGAGSASAQSRVVATLDAPVRQGAQFIAAHAVWTCSGTTCVTSQAPEDAISASGCAEVATIVGPVSAFVGEDKSLDSKSLNRCNKAFAPAVITSAAR
jgi:hypothetical protein